MSHHMRRERQRKFRTSRAVRAEIFTVNILRHVDTETTVTGYGHKDFSGTLPPKAGL